MHWVGTLGAMREEFGHDAAHVAVDPEDGGRLLSLHVLGEELLLQHGEPPFGFGSFVMAPYAGRVRDGRFSVDGTLVSLPLSLPPHAAHGLVSDRPWRVLSREERSITLQCPLDDRWPFQGVVEQAIEVSDSELHLSITVRSRSSAFPASVGWHPWFNRSLGVGEPASLQFEAGAMLRRDERWITTSEQVPVPSPPYDDCFVDVDWPVMLRWAGFLDLAISADTACVVLFDLPRDAICVEPQTAPPDVLNTVATAVTPRTPLTAHTTWRWTPASPL